MHQVDQKAILFDSHSHGKEGIQLSSGFSKSITEGGINFLGKLLEVSLSATKAAANEKMTDTLSHLLSAINMLPIRGEYKLWLYHNYIDAITKSAITKLENLATRYLKKWLRLPRSATRAILYYPGVCCPSISQVSQEAKLSLLSCVSATGDPQLQQLGLQLIWGMNIYRLRLQTIIFCSKLVHNYHHFPWLALFTNCLGSC